MGINSVLNLNTALSTKNFLNYIEDSFSATVADCYDSLDEKCKNALRMMETPGVMLKKLWKEIEIEFNGAKLGFEKKVESGKERIRI